MKNKAFAVIINVVFLITNPVFAMEDSLEEMSSPIAVHRPLSDTERRDELLESSSRKSSSWRTSLNLNPRECSFTTKILVGGIVLATVAYTCDAESLTSIYDVIGTTCYSTFRNYDGVLQCIPEIDFTNFQKLNFLLGKNCDPLSWFSVPVWYSPSKLLNMAGCHVQGAIEAMDSIFYNGYHREGIYSLGNGVHQLSLGEMTQNSTHFICHYLGTAMRQCGGWSSPFIPNSYVIDLIFKK